MKNLSSLGIVLCLLIVLGCRCQSDLFGTKRDAYSTPAPTAYPTPAFDDHSSNNRNRSENRNSSENRNGSSDSSESAYLATGTYTGRGINTTYNRRGDFLLRVDSVNSVGRIRAYFAASNGLQGTAIVTGSVDSKGKLTLSGTLDDGQSLAISGTVNGSTISAGYGLADPQLKTQQGNFTVTRR